jgi:hypothetical protein
VDWVCESSRVGVLVPGHAVDDPHWSLPGFGVVVGDGNPVGLSEGIARWLLDGRPAHVVGNGSRDLRGFDGLLVMGDGSSSRTDKAPGHLHPGALAFDAELVTALADGDVAALAGLDLQLAAEVGAAGAPAWSALSQQLVGVSSSHVDLQQDPYGVLYVVARWFGQWAAPA